MSGYPAEAVDPVPPIYLDVDDVLALHAALFAISARQAADRLRSRSVLEGALSRPWQYAAYADADLALQTAVLAHGIAEGQAFIDGNKRTTLLTLTAFLEINGFEVTMTPGALAHVILELSQRLDVEALADRIREQLTPVA
jgi:death on curing protein